MDLSCYCAKIDKHYGFKRCMDWPIGKCIFAHKVFGNGSTGLILTLYKNSHKSKDWRWALNAKCLIQNIFQSCNLPAALMLSILSTIILLTIILHSKMLLERYTLICLCLCWHQFWKYHQPSNSMIEILLIRKPSIVHITMTAYH